MSILFFEYDLNGFTLECEAHYEINDNGSVWIDTVAVTNFDTTDIYIMAEKSRPSDDGERVMQYDAVLRSSNFDELRGELELRLSVKQCFFSLEKLIKEEAHRIIKDRD